MPRDLDNSADIIDSRDVIARIAKLENERAAQPNKHDRKIWDRSDDGEELAKLRALDSEGEGCADWKHGETLIRYSYFEEYARQLAEDLGCIKSDAAWPANCIDWERAARELQMDYSSISFDGVEYWIRC